VTENVSVERVAINRLLEDEDLPLPREKDGVLIIPLIEEVQVVITQYMLREEVHISKQRRTTTTPEAVIVRREVVQIEREMPDGTIVTEHIAQSD
jgi:stress response protein YsnF